MQMPYRYDMLIWPSHKPCNVALAALVILRQIFCHSFYDVHKTCADILFSGKLVLGDIKEL